LAWRHPCGVDTLFDQGFVAGSSRGHGTDTRDERPCVRFELTALA
jgi:hypothetical protein